MTAIETNNNVADSDNVIHYVRTAFPINTLNQLYSDKQLCDVQVKIGNHHYDCHRIILAASSAYFLAMFTSNLNESRQTIVEIKEADQEAIAILIDYFYSGKIEINTSNAQSIAVTSSMLGVDEIVDECCHFISNVLVANNCLEIRSFAQLHHFELLSEAADQFIANHFSEIIETDSFVQMPYDYLIVNLRQSYLKVYHEIEVFDALIKWIKYDLEGRRSKLPELLDCVRLALIPIEILIARVESEELIVGELQCQRQLHRAKNFRFMPERLFSAKTQPRHYHTTKLLTIEQQTYQNMVMYCDTKESHAELFRKKIQRTNYAILTLDKKLFFFGGTANSCKQEKFRWYYGYDYKSKDNWPYGKFHINQNYNFAIEPYTVYCAV